MGVRPVGVTIGSVSKLVPQHNIEVILQATGTEECVGASCHCWI